MQVVVRDPNKGYLDCYLWVPRSYINVEGTKRSLTHVFTEYGGAQKVITLYQEAPHHLLVPRAFWEPGALPFEVVDCRPLSHTLIPFVSRVQLDHRVQLDVNGQHALLPTGEDVQRKSFNAMQEAMGGVLQLGCGKGKGQPLTEVVMTPTGERTIGAVQVGDLVLGSDGHPRKVLGVYPQGVRPVYRIFFSDETSVRADDQHLWSVRVDNRRHAVVSTQQLLASSLKSKAGLRFAIKYCQPARFSRAQLAVNPWLLGAWLGDGSAYGQPIFTNPEDDVLKHFERELPEGDRAILRQPKNRCKELRVIGGQLMHRLSTYGLAGCRSWEKYIPEVYLHTDAEDRWELLRGLLDTDGSIANQNKTVEYTTVSTKLAQQVMWLVRSLGGRASCRERVTTFTYKGKLKEGRPSYRIRVTFPEGGARPVSSRKHLARWDATPGQRRFKYITAIRLEGREETVCIKVDAEDSCYLTRDFTVTHNTCIALHHLAESKVPALVMVDNTQLMEQWSKEIEQLIEVPGGVGLIADGQKDWKRGLVLGTYISVANWADTMPEEVRRWFGNIYWDEGHHLSAPVFSKTAALFYGRRYCLTATPERDDGFHIIADMHVGKVLHKDLRQPLKSRFIFYWTGLELDLADPNCSVLDRNQEVHTSKVFKYFGRWRARLGRILQDCTDAVQSGRKVLVVCSSVDEVVNLMALWTRGPNTPLITDIPYPSPQDVGETLLPYALGSVEAQRLQRNVEKQRRLVGQARTNGTAPQRLQEMEERLVTLETDWARFKVYQKLEYENDRRRRNFIRALTDEPSTAGFMTAEVPAVTRQSFVQTRSVTFAIMKYGKEGLDAPHLDTILVSTPFSNRAGLQQLMGRITGRPLPGKKTCLVVFYRDNIGIMHGMCDKLEKHLRQWPLDEGGPLEHEYLNHPKRKQWQKTASLKDAFGQ